MRELEMSARTVEEAVQAACAALGVDRDDLNVSYEVLVFPEKKFFRSIPAKVRVTVTDPEPAPAPAPAPVPAAPAPKPVPAASKPAPDLEAPATKPAPVPEAPAAKPAPAPAAANPADVPLPLEENPRLQLAVDYLRPIFALLGAQDPVFTAAQRGEAVVLKVRGEHLGGLIGRRGETMEALSYLASLVVNRSEGDYIKLGLDVGGYRAKREADLTALARRAAERVARSGYSYEMEPMNPYERHIIHTAVADIEGVRSESKGEGPDRRVVLYSTDPNASNQPDRAGYRPPRGGRGSGNRDRAPRGRGPRPDRNDRGSRSGGPRGGGRYDRDGRRGPRSSSVPPREYADRPWDPSEQPTVPSRTERIHDGDEFAFGKIDL